MAIYHLSVKIVSRNTGRTAVAAAAYRSAKKLYCEYDGTIHDFTKKGWVTYTEIMLPENAPSEYIDRSVLWNAVEKSERSKNAQVAREFEVALPIEMTPEQQIKLVRAFVKETLVSDGMIADIAIHNPPVTDDKHHPIDAEGNITHDKHKMIFRNPHAHILTTMRPLDESGRFCNKTKTEYICRRGDEEQVFIDSEFGEAQKHGWEKQYKYYISGRKQQYFTPSEANKKSLTRASRAPKTTPYGRKNETIKRWNSTEQIYIWRRAWENTVNSAFASINSDIRIDSRSYIDQGRTDEIPTTHMGISATNIQRRSERLSNENPDNNSVDSELAELNKQIIAHNTYVARMRKLIGSAIESAKEYIKRTARKLEMLRAEIISHLYDKAILEQRYIQEKDNADNKKSDLSLLNEEVSKTISADKESTMLIKDMNKELKQTPVFNRKKRNHLKNEINTEKESISHRAYYLTGCLNQYGLKSTEELKQLQNEIVIHNEIILRISQIIKSTTLNIRSSIADYNSVKEMIPFDRQDQIDQLRLAYRPVIEKKLIEGLKTQYGDDFSNKQYQHAINDTDKKLNNDRTKNDLFFPKRK